MTNRWAFLVGVNRYSDPNFGTLKFCVNDVLALEQILTQLGYQVVCLHDELDRDNRLFPTRDNVEARLIELCQAVQPDDLVWVHFACHGTRAEKESKKKEPVLITQDTQLTLLNQRALSVAEVERHMRDSGGNKLVLSLDACHSGVDIGRDLTDPEFIKNVYDLAEGFALIAASTAEQTALEWQQVQHGVFTYYLLEGLSGKADRNGKKMVTVDDLKNHVLDALRRWNVKHGGVQEPTARTEGLGDIILADYRGDIRKAVVINSLPVVELVKSPLTPTQRSHLEQELKEQQQEYDYRNQEIEFLSNSEKIDDLRPQERFRLTQQIAEAKQKRERAAKRMEELEKELNL